MNPRFHMKTISVLMFSLAVFGVAIVCAEGSRWTGKRVLIVGDSLVGDGSGLEKGLRASFEAENASVVTMAEIGGRASSWARSDELREKIASWRPHAIVLALGMNSCRTDTKAYKRHVRAISALLRGIECHWIGPPLLVEGTAGFVIALPDMVKDNSHCRYFDTVERVSFPMGSVSGFHVRRWKGKKWAKQVWGWINK